MMGAVYLIFLLASLGCMVLLDQRLRLFFWHDAARAALVLTAGVLFFLAWDLAGIGLGIFYRGQTEIMLGVSVAPELPLEEIVFLTFLCYLVMNLFSMFRRGFDGFDGHRALRRRTRGAEEHP